MAKTIKFYMICDDHPVRTIDDLREHFGMEDVLGYYRRGILQRWLKVRGYDAELEAVNQMNAADDAEALTKLIRIFDVEKDPSEIAEFIKILKYNEEKAKAAEEKKKKEEEEKIKAEEQKKNKDGQNANASDSDKARYLSLVNTILENSTNKAVIKSTVKEIAENYRHIFEQNYVDLFYLLYKCAPMAIFVMLSFDVMREKYLSDHARREPVLPENTLGIDLSILLRNKQKMVATGGPMYTKVEEQLSAINNLKKNSPAFGTMLDVMLQESRLREILPKDLKKFSLNTFSEWRQLEPKGKKCMIFKVGIGQCVGPSGQRGSKTLGTNDCLGKFVLLDGIDIITNSCAFTYYMEV